MSSLGITTDFLIYSIIIPVMPFHLQALGYSEISVLVGYLLFAYVRRRRFPIQDYRFDSLPLPSLVA